MWFKKIFFMLEYIDLTNAHISAPFSGVASTSFLFICGQIVIFFCLLTGLRRFSIIKSTLVSIEYFLCVHQKMLSFVVAVNHCGLAYQVEINVNFWNLTLISVEFLRRFCNWISVRPVNKIYETETEEK